ncbi:MAG: class I SAM-dependent methyltransferase [Deltaproteobacteria bacterium]|nr:class I SAM-dependent methyltransferase [Deltaproteobacteria bacterium]
MVVTLPPSAANLAWAQKRWRQSGVTAPAVAACLGGAADALTLADRLPLWLWRTREPTAFAALVRLFVLGQPVGVAWLTSALPDAFAWEKRGLLQVRGKQAHATLALSFHDGFEIVADVEPRSANDEREHVMGVTSASQTLQRCLMPGTYKQALDVGTGSGVVALALASQCRNVLGTDINRRALAFARLNAKLVGATNIRFARTSLFKGLPQNHFDLIVGNLPFVISPEQRFVYRDGGLPLDAFSATVVGQAALHLRPGAHAQFLVQWVHPREPLADAQEREEERLASWVADSACHLLALRFRAQKVEDYALEWSRGPFAATPAAAVKRFDAWMRFYERHNIAAVSTGLIVLQRLRDPSRERPWLAVQDWPTPEGPCGADIAAQLAEIAASL